MPLSMQVWARQADDNVDLITETIDILQGDKPAPVPDRNIGSKPPGVDLAAAASTQQIATADPSPNPSLHEKEYKKAGLNPDEP